MPTNSEIANSDTIRAVLDFARKLRGEIPDRLVERPESVELAYNRQSRMLERERVAFALLRLLEDSGINIHEEV